MRKEYQMGITNLRLSKLINNISACLSLSQWLLWTAQYPRILLC